MKNPNAILSKTLNDLLDRATFASVAILNFDVCNLRPFRAAFLKETRLANVSKSRKSVLDNNAINLQSHTSKQGS